MIVYSICLLSLILCFVICGIKGEDVVINIPNLGKVKGEQGEDVLVFKGIPYAEPPVNEKRFQSPEKKTPWGDNVFDATTFGPGCPQHCEMPPKSCPKSYSEDCLTLNVWTPKNALVKKNDGKLPVLAWIHGGHLEFGASGVPLFDCERIVQKAKVVCVSFNYRLGFLGFGVYKPVGLEGNMGFRDQQLAMQWIQDNIAAFGGDPSTVTLAGESSGAQSVMGHLVAPSSWNLYHRAIVMSDPLTLPMLNTTEQSDNYGRHFMKNIGCSNKDCLMSSSTDRIIKAQLETAKSLNLSHPLYAFLPITIAVDGDLVPANGLDAMLQGKINNVPIVMGSTTEEAWIFAYALFQSSLGSVKYTSIVTYLFHQHIAFTSVLKYFPPSVFGDNRPTFSLLGSDYIFHCANRYAWNTYSKLPGRAPIYAYELNMTLSWPGWGKNFAFCDGHSCHGVDLPYFFQSPPLFNVTFTEDEQRMSDSMIDMLIANFGRTSDPNSGPVQTTISWPAWDNSMKNLQFTGHNFIDTNPRDTVCNMFDSLPDPYHYGV